VKDDVMKGRVQLNSRVTTYAATQWIRYSLGERGRDGRIYGVSAAGKYLAADLGRRRFRTDNHAGHDGSSILGTESTIPYSALLFSGCSEPPFRLVTFWEGTLIGE
jgi:hypothetical protein